MRRFEPSTQPHSCRTPALSTIGDLWRCSCGRLWAVRIYMNAGARPVRHWARPPLRTRIRYARWLDRLDWPIAGTVFMLACLVALVVLQMWEPAS